MTVEDIEIEYQKFRKKQRKMTGYDMWKVYQWYWYKDSKPFLEKLHNENRHRKGVSKR